jgi:aminopeptidase N
MTSRLPLRRAALALVAAVTVAAAPVPVLAHAAPQRVVPPTPGAPGIGDRLYPTLGNGGYDALHYALDLRYATRAPGQGVDGTVTMVARATQSLSRFDLDFSGTGVGSVTVDGHAARFVRRGAELVVVPARPIADHDRFTVTVHHFTARPRVADPERILSTAFVSTRDGSVTAGQPNVMHAVYPCNDHPRDKASFSFRFDVPAGTTAVANGVLTGRHRHGSRMVWTYQQRQPMATELTQLAVGAFTVIRRASVDGVQVRDVVPTRLVPQYRSRLAVERGQLQWMRARVGAFPFDAYGSLVVGTRLGFALETQTLSLFDTAWFTTLPRGVWDPVMLHELSHHWFGDSVAPYEWSDVWLNEGHATWYEFTYAAQRRYLDDDTGIARLPALMRSLYRAGDSYRSAFGPVARPRTGDPDAVFNPNVYEGGALVLFALRQRVGDPTFRRIERAWVTRYRNRSASTRDFIRLASQVSGRDLDPFLTSWLYARRTPPMPGYPRWTVDPVGQGPSPSRTVESALRAPVR